MDFAKPLECVPSVASRSNIRYIIPTTTSRRSKKKEEDQEDDVSIKEEGDEEKQSKALDDILLEEANAAAVDLLLGPTAVENIIAARQKQSDERNDDGNKDIEQEQERLDHLLEQQVDTALYPERCKRRTNINGDDTIKEGDLVVIMISFDNLSFLYAEKGQIFSNRNGHFHHDDFLYKPYGCKIRSRNNRGYGFCYLLKPTPELWARSLNHRTQIVHELDQSQILFQLHLRPNSIVVESGTGSGAMSHAILRSIAPAGHLHTYEFNQQRAETARREFQQHGLLQNLVTVHHADVCGKKPIVTTTTTANGDGLGGSSNGGGDAATSATTTAVNINGGGFGLPGQSVDAVFLDLPEPWLAVPHAAFVLKVGGRIASYSPCMEQTQRTIQAMQHACFHSIKTMEFRLQEHYVDEMEYESPPRHKRPRLNPHPQQQLFQQPQHQQQQQQSTETTAAKDAEVNVEKVYNAKKENPDNGDQYMQETGEDESKEEPDQQKEQGKEPSKKKTMLVARPYSMMRGHTAFLTFASAGNIPQPNPAANLTATGEGTVSKGGS